MPNRNSNLLVLLSLILCCGCSAAQASTLRVGPYLQNPAVDAMTIVWFSNDDARSRIQVSGCESSAVDALVFDGWSNPGPATAIQYKDSEISRLADSVPTTIPYIHEERITGLLAATCYRYQVTHGDTIYKSTFRTAGLADSRVRIIAYADSETEPESTGKKVAWPGVEQDSADQRLYLVDQTTGYEENLKVIASRNPDLVAIAGDLVQFGGEQRDWDEFWRHNENLAASVPIVPALGNHEYASGPPQEGMWDTEATELAVGKYKTYFSVPDNGAQDPRHNERYYSLHYGPVSLITLDTTDGSPNRSKLDTHWDLLGENDGAVAPAWQPGSAQHEWLIKQLKLAQESSKFTIVMFHQSPYTSGVHGHPLGPNASETNVTSSQPLQILTPLFLDHGVDLVLGGHGEMAEHSVVQETRGVGNSEVVRSVHFYDIGIGGDGLRGPAQSISNPHRTFLAHSDSIEKYSEDGTLLDGGKHYGHLEIEIGPDGSGKWTLKAEFVYVFPVTDPAGNVVRFERRVYDDRIVLPAQGN
jgi:hypothetical protein